MSMPGFVADEVTASGPAAAAAPDLTHTDAAAPVAQTLPLGDALRTTLADPEKYPEFSLKPKEAGSSATFAKGMTCSASAPRRMTFELSKADAKLLPGIPTEVTATIRNPHPFPFGVRVPEGYKAEYGDGGPYYATPMPVVPKGMSAATASALSKIQALSDDDKAILSGTVANAKRYAVLRSMVPPGHTGRQAVVKAAESFKLERKPYLVKVPEFAGMRGGPPPVSVTFPITHSNVTQQQANDLVQMDGLIEPDLGGHKYVEGGQVEVPIYTKTGDRHPVGMLLHHAPDDEIGKELAASIQERRKFHFDGESALMVDLANGERDQQQSLFIPKAKFELLHKAAKMGLENAASFKQASFTLDPLTEHCEHARMNAGAANRRVHVDMKVTTLSPAEYAKTM